MSPNRRIFLNIVATYGRSLYALVLGLFSARWTLVALGVIDYGLLGVVGGLTALVDFFNSLMANSVGRFYAYYVGAAKKDVLTGLENCRKWFNTALLVHTVLPVFLIIIGYPIGDWAVRYFLTIPVNRIEDCVWVWRCACVSCFVGMVGVPFAAMYYAKQEIAELTLYSVVSTTLKALFLYYMVTNPGIWLAKYALFGCVIFVVPQLIICVRAMLRYPECKFRWQYIWDRQRIKEVLVYSLSRFWPSISVMCNGQGQALLINKYLGPDANASISIGNSVSAHAQTFSAAISGSFNPAITNLAGEGDMEKMRRMAFSASKLSTIMLLVFAIPLSLEIHEVMRLWLKTPPHLAAELCVLILVVILLEKLTDGHWMCILALGRVVKYSFVVGWSGIIALILAWGFLGRGYGILSMGIAMIMTKIFEVVVRLYYGRILAGLSIRYWVCRVFIPIMISIILSLLLGMLPRLCMTASFLRCLVTGFLADLALMPIAWGLLLDKGEQLFLLKKIQSFAIWSPK